jgi:uncharacterized membrane protein
MKLPGGRAAAGPLACWVLTRGTLLALTTLTPGGIRGTLEGDPYLYQIWASGIVHGHFPLSDVRWQYPPAAALALAAPQILPGSYLHALWALVLATDLAVELVLIARATGAGRSARGLWVWTLVLPLVGPLLLNRFDVLPAALVVLAAVAEAWPFLCAACIGLAVLVKLWPMALAGLPLRGARWKAPLWGYAAPAVVVALALVPHDEVLASIRAFVSHQASRGLQIESLAALPVMIHSAVAGTVPAITYQDGSDQLIRPGLTEVAHVCAVLALLVAVLTAAGGLVLARRGSGAAAVLDLAFAGTLLTLDVAEVLSPQYLIWVVALAAAALTRAESRAGPATLALAVACPLTAVVFPFLYTSYYAAEPFPVALETLRDAALLVATALALRAVRWNEFAHQRPSMPREGSH